MVQRDVRRKRFNFAAAVCSVLSVTLVISWLASPWGRTARNISAVHHRGATYFLVSRGMTLRVVRQNLTIRSHDSHFGGNVNQAGLLVVKRDGQTVLEVPHEVA